MKGIVFLIEAVISIVLILSMIILILQTAERLSGLSIANYKLRIYEILTALERKGNLRQYAVSSDVAAINSNLDPFIPNNINFYTVIFNSTTNISSIPDFQGEKNVVSVDYLVAGDFNDYNPLIVTVFLWD